MEIQQAWYRINVKSLIYNEDGDFPVGGLKHGEKSEIYYKNKCDLSDRNIKYS